MQSEQLFPELYGYTTQARKIILKICNINENTNGQWLAFVVYTYGVLHSIYS